MNYEGRTFQYNTSNEFNNTVKYCPCVLNRDIFMRKIFVYFVSNQIKYFTYIVMFICYSATIIEQFSTHVLAD